MSLREKVIIGIAIVAISSAVYSWYHPQQVPGPGQWSNVTKNVTVAPTVTCQNGTLLVKTPETAPNAQEGTKEPIIVEGHVHGFDLKTGLSVTTGQATIYAMPTRRPLFGFENGKEIGFRYNGIQANVFGRWTFVRVGNVYGALYGEGATDQFSRTGSRMFAGLELSYRW